MEVITICAIPGYEFCVRCSRIIADDVTEHTGRKFFVRVNPGISGRAAAE
jgi:hypothetical protein